MFRLSHFIAIFRFHTSLGVIGRHLFSSMVRNKVRSESCSNIIYIHVTFPNCGHIIIIIIIITSKQPNNQKHTVLTCMWSLIPHRRGRWLHWNTVRHLAACLCRHLRPSHTFSQCSRPDRSRRIYQPDPHTSLRSNRGWKRSPVKETRSNSWRSETPFQRGWLFCRVQMWNGWFVF